MFRETTFVLGGALTIALGIALLIGLYFAGAGIAYVEVWLVGGVAIGFGAFFVRVGRDEGRVRREQLRELDRETSGLPPRPPS